MIVEYLLRLFSCEKPYVCFTQNTKEECSGSGCVVMCSEYMHAFIW